MKLVPVLLVCDFEAVTNLSTSPNGGNAETIDCMDIKNVSEHHLRQLIR